MNNLTKLLLVIVIFGSVTPALLFSQSWVWEKQAEGLAYNWEAIDAIDSNVAVGSAVENKTGNAAIYRTLNAGVAWQRIPWPWLNTGLIDIAATDSLKIWAVSTRKIYHTSDGGKNWAIQYHADTTALFMNYIEMFDSLRGVAMGDALPGRPILILRTENGGKNWISQNQSYFVEAHSADVWRCIDFVSPEIGYGRFTHFNQSLDTIFLQKTFDGGQTWQPTSLAASKFSLIRFFNDKIGIAASQANLPIYRTLDGGDTWQEYLLPVQKDKKWAMDIEFLPQDISKLLAAFGNSLFFSSDTGKTWVQINAPDLLWYMDIEMVDHRHGWIAGREGIIHASASGITSLKSNNDLVVEFVLQQNFPNPFNLTTEIAFHLKYPAVVELRIYNLAGEEVATLLKNQMCQAGRHSVKFNGSGLASGIYLYRLSSPQGIETKRMVLLK